MSDQQELTHALVRVSAWLSALPRPSYRGPGLRSTPIAEIETLVAAVASAMSGSAQDREAGLGPQGQERGAERGCPEPTFLIQAIQGVR